MLEASATITAAQLAALKAVPNRIFLKGRTLRDLTLHIADPAVYPDVALVTPYGRSYYY